jgi:Protein of unknown function (DUF1524)
LTLDLLKALATSDPGNAGDTVERFLLTQAADSRFWPPDSMVDEALRGATIYKSLVRARLRMLLEAIEDQLHTTKGEGTRCPQNLTVEHIMPQAWREHWGTGEVDDAAAAARDRLVQSLGNLPLVTGKLNPSLSNRPWTSHEATARGLTASGKRDELLRHSELKLNALLALLIR